MEVALPLASYLTEQLLPLVAVAVVLAITNKAMAAVVLVVAALTVLVKTERICSALTQH
jgi:Na+-translocating ferredoxin:NAD+ oxidoreductase RnfE subunit